MRRSVSTAVRPGKLLIANICLSKTSWTTVTQSWTGSRSRETSVLKVALIIYILVVVVFVILGLEITDDAAKL